MSINVSTGMGFENREFLKNMANEILQKSGAKKDTASEIAQKIILPSSNFNSYDHFDALNSSAQFMVNNSLKETLKYLRTHAKDKRKKYVFGELWNLFEGLENNNDNSYTGELIDFEIKEDKKNIFAA